MSLLTAYPGCQRVFLLSEEQKASVLAIAALPLTVRAKEKNLWHPGYLFLGLTL